MGRSSKSAGPSHQVVCIQPPPSTEGMFLEKVKLGRVLAFCKRFNAEAARYMGGLNISNYISERVLSQMKMIAAKYDMPGKNGILVNGEQRVSNTEAYGILAVMCAPRNLEEMQRQLLKTSWPVNIKHDYKDVSVIEKYISEYKTDVLIYIDRFEDKIRLLSYTTEGFEFLPKTLFKKGGGNPGLADYFLGGLPEKDFGLRVWNSVKEEKRNACVDWAQFTETYVEAIEMMEERKRSEDINKHIYKGAKKMVKDEEADEVSLRKPRGNKERGQRLHVMHDEEDSSDQERLATVLDSEAELSEVEESLSSIRKSLEDETELDIGDDDDFVWTEISNLVQPRSDGIKGICFEMLNKGKCDRVNCPYSHNPDEIAKARKLKEARKASMISRPPMRGGPPPSGPPPSKFVTMSRGSSGSRPKT